MKIIAIYQGKPIYTTNEDIIDVWKIGQSMVKHGFCADFEEYKRNTPAFWADLKRGFDIKVWKYNPIQKDWIEQ